MARTARLTASVLLALLAGCGETPAGSVMSSLLWPLPVPSLAAAAEEEPAPLPEARDAEGPLLLLTAPRRAALVPISQGGGRVLWRGQGSNIAIATEGARVVATAGLAQTLSATRLEGPDPLEDPRTLAGRQARLRRMVDLAGANREPEGMRFGLMLDCLLEGEAQGGWILVEEHCRGRGVSFTNRYWALAETGQVVRSEQWAGDTVGSLVLQFRG